MPSAPIPLTTDVMRHHEQEQVGPSGFAAPPGRYGTRSDFTLATTDLMTPTTSRYGGREPPRPLPFFPVNTFTSRSGLIPVLIYRCVSVSTRFSDSSCIIDTQPATTTPSPASSKSTGPQRGWSWVMVSLTYFFFWLCWCRCCDDERNF